MKELFFLILIFLFASSLYGQEDSLLQVLRESKDVEIQHAVLRKLYINNLYTNPNYSDSITNLAVRITEEAGHDSLRSISYHMKASVKSVLTEYDSSLFYIQKNHELIDKNNFISRRASNYAMEGLIYYYKGAFNKSLEKSFAALRIQKNLGLKSKQILTLNNIGIAYERLEEFEKAIEIYRQASELIPEEDTYGKAGILANMGVIHINLNQIGQAKDSFLQAKALLNTGEHLSLLNDIDHGLARVYQKEKNFDQAILVAKEIMQRAKDSNDLFRQARMSQFLGELLIEVKDYKGAVKNLEDARKLAEEKQIGEMLIPIYNHLRIAYEGIGKRDLAITAMDSLANIRKALFNTEKRRITEELDLKYQTALKDTELEKSKQATLQKTYQRNIAIIGLLFLLAIGAFIWQRSKSTQLKQQKVDILQKQKIQDLEKERMIFGISSMLEGQEKERSRIAKDLHDGLGSLLSSVKAHFSAIEGEIKQLDKLDVYKNAQNMMDNACEEVRRISHNLMPPLLNSQGLSSALKDLVSDYEVAHKLNITLDIQGMEERIAAKTEMVVYRICQELLNNIQKHANAEQIEISLYGLNQNIQLIVEDNGVGFDSDKVSPGLGLISIQSRVDFLNGTMDIDASEGKGTSISISIPK